MMGEWVYLDQGQRLTGVDPELISVLIFFIALLFFTL